MRSATSGSRVVGTDTGMPIGYALAADHPDRVERLAVSEASIPGVTPSPPLILPSQVNTRLWHLAFNQLPPRSTRRSSEDARTSSSARSSGGGRDQQLPDDTVRYYIDLLVSDPARCAAASVLPRAEPAPRRTQRKARRLTLPVLAMGGAESTGESVGNG